MLIALIACATDPLDSGLIDYPTWSGTQIGDSGDEPCPLVAEPWTEEDVAPDGSVLTPAEVRALGGDFAGTLTSDWQGDADITATVTLDGPAQALSGKFDHCQPAMGLSGTLTLTADALYSAVLPVEVMVSHAHVAMSATADGTAHDGSLSPGILPDDAAGLFLVLDGRHREDAWEGALSWKLERDDGSEEWAPAADWLVE